MIALVDPDDQARPLDEAAWLILLLLFLPPAPQQHRFGKWTGSPKRDARRELSQKL